MPPNRTSRRRTIPENLIVNWRPSDLHDGAKPLLRRPVTACDACRTAKAKCSGKQGCGRCTARGLVCTYTSQIASNRRSPGESNVQPPSIQARSPGQDIAQEVPAVIAAGSITASGSLNSMEYQSSAGLESIRSAGGTNVLHHQSIHPVNWGPVDTRLEGQAFSSAAESGPLGNDTSQCVADIIPQTSLQDGYNSPCGNEIQGSSSAVSEPSISLAFEAHQATSPNRLCRPNLMVCLSKITDAMQHKRLDEVFKVTGELIKRCQDVIDCTTNNASCTDLLLVVTALQEIQPCFDYIAKSELNSPVKLSYGGYEVSLNDANLRAMLVMDLVQRTNTLLTSISSKGQSMINQLSEPSCLARANIAYLEAMISHVKTILRCVSVYMEEAVQNGDSVPETPLNASASAST